MAGNPYHHRGAEDTEVRKRKNPFRFRNKKKVFVLRDFCVLGGEDFLACGAASVYNYPGTTCSAG